MSYCLALCSDNKRSEVNELRTTLNSLEVQRDRKKYREVGSCPVPATALPLLLGTGCPTMGGICCGPASLFVLPTNILTGLPESDPLHDAGNRCVSTLYRDGHGVIDSGSGAEEISLSLPVQLCGVACRFVIAAAVHYVCRMAVPTANLT